jgi:hypothetical protein
MDNKFEQGDRVVANDLSPYVPMGETGTVTNPDHIGTIIVNLDDDELNRQALGCFMPGELDKQS